MVRQIDPVRSSRWRVLRVAVVLGWVAWAAIAWWSAPRESSAAQARADLAAQRLTYHEWGTGWENDGGIVGPFPGGLERGNTGPTLLWHTTDGRRYFTTVDNAALDEDNRPVDGKPLLVSGPEANALETELQAGAADRPFDLPLGTIQGLLPVAAAVLFLWVLLAAPAPVIGTKWFWFWLVAGVPLGLGLLWWLARERPWSSRAEPRVSPLGEDRPLKWWAGIGISIIAGLAISLALAGLRGSLGEVVVPTRR